MHAYSAKKRKKRPQLCHRTVACRRNRAIHIIRSERAGKKKKANATLSHNPTEFSSPRCAHDVRSEQPRAQKHPPSAMCVRVALRPFPCPKQYPSIPRPAAHSAIFSFLRLPACLLLRLRVVSLMASRLHSPAWLTLTLKSPAWRRVVCRGWRVGWVAVCPLYKSQM